MKCLKTFVICASLLTSVLVFAQEAKKDPPPPAADNAGQTSSRPPETRDTWYIGFNIYPVGQVKAKFDDDNEILSDFERKRTFGIQFGGGATVNSKLLAGAEIISISQERENDDLDVDNTLTEAAAAILGVVTYFPMEKGLLLRGGLGIATYTLKLDVDYGGGIKYTTSDSVNGLGLLLGVGYAWWLGESFNLTANLDYMHQSYNKEIGKSEFDIKVKDVSATALGIGFQWY